MYYLPINPTSFDIHDITAETPRLVHQRRYARWKRGERRDRFRRGKQYQRMWKSHQDHTSNYHTIRYAYGVQLVWWLADKTGRHTHHTRYESIQCNRADRHDTKRALRMGIAIDARTYRRRLPYID